MGTTCVGNDWADIGTVFGTLFDRGLRLNCRIEEDKASDEKEVDETEANVEE